MKADMKLYNAIFQYLSFRANFYFYMEWVANTSILFEEFPCSSGEKPVRWPETLYSMAFVKAPASSCFYYSFITHFHITFHKNKVSVLNFTKQC